ncbi:MAG: type II/IV secretion system ATPase subunit [Methanomicrobiaceae archaeon]|nr:type II/IV secretion system ATPase subunit [Methanomicrobiaceae archaeon]
MSSTAFEISENTEYVEIFVESNDSLENNIATELYPATDGSGESVTEGFIAPSGEEKSTVSLKSAIDFFKGSLFKNSSGKPEKDVNREEKEGIQTPEKSKTNISEYLKDRYTILRNSIIPEKAESGEQIFYHSDYPEKPDIKPELLPDSVEVLECHWLNPPHSYACIYEDSNKNLFYSVFEPEISMKERIILEETDSHLKSVLIYDSPASQVPGKIDSRQIFSIARNFDDKIQEDRVAVIEYYLKRNFHGYGKLDPLMRDENIEDITCNGSGIPVYLYHRKYANLPTNLVFEPSEINRFVMKLAQKADKQLSLTSPLVDAALPGGARAQITYTDVVSSKGSSFTIRKFRSEPMTPADLIYYGTYDSEIMALIWLAVENRRSMIVVGGTASGKTSTMNAVSLFIPRHSKVVSIEDTRELYMPHENWLPMKTRESAAESGKGNVDMFSLLRSALRQRPEYIIVGEVRGKEAQTLFQAMNTGHTTYSTLHAGGVEQAVNRLTTDPINVPVAMFGALDLIVIQQLQYVKGRMVRRCTSLNEVVVEKSRIRWNKIFEWDPVSDSFKKTGNHSMVIEGIAYMHGWSYEEALEEIRLRKQVLDTMVTEDVHHFREVSGRIENFRREYVY